MFLHRTLQTYRSNFRAAVAFLLLLVFVFPFTAYLGGFVSSGSVFLDYQFVKSDPLLLAALMISLLVFYFFYSLFQTLLVFAVRRDLSPVKVDYYLREQMQKFTTKIMLFNLLFSVLFAWMGGFLILFGIAPSVIALILLALSFPFLFFPQAVVIDERSWLASLRASVSFSRTNPKQVLAVVGIGFLLLLLAALIEFAVDQVILVGNYVSLLLVLGGVVPFLEILKTDMYISKYGLVSAAANLPAPRKPRPTPVQ